MCEDRSSDADADIPDSFAAVQWMRLPGGEASAEFCDRVKNAVQRASDLEKRVNNGGPIYYR